MDDVIVSRYGNLLQVDGPNGKALYNLADFISYSVTTIRLEGYEDQEVLAGNLVLEFSNSQPPKEYSFIGDAAAQVYEIIRQYYGDN